MDKWRSRLLRNQRRRGHFTRCKERQERNPRILKTGKDILQLKYLTYKDGSKQYWIGLTNMKLKHLFLNGFAWLDETQPATYVNWVPQNTSGYGATLVVQKDKCATTNPRVGAWSKENCYPTKNFFICEKFSASNPGPPSVDIDLGPGNGFAYIGYEMTAKCSAFTPLGATVRFWIENESGLIDVDRDGAFPGVKFKMEEAGRVCRDGRRLPARDSNHSDKRIDLRDARNQPDLVLVFSDELQLLGLNTNSPAL
ncbi:hypothetical protein RRG08_023598 [Elysia crispata]|uniref:C-type lectin domain-containing protein n=1 Tax=Elysia crispata TaxID=231223 RepID=A0AAE1B7M5_9GAST|nr:hypothetical protein RRG08_023598 [Elysia crispata]